MNHPDTAPTASLAEQKFITLIGTIYVRSAISLPLRQAGVLLEHCDGRRELVTHTLPEEYDALILRITERRLPRCMRLHTIIEVGDQSMEFALGDAVRADLGDYVVTFTERPVEGLRLFLAD